MLPPTVPFPPGEAEALRRLRAFAGGSTTAIRGYADDRNRMDLDGTSQLSPYLRFGMVSARAPWCRRCTAWRLHLLSRRAAVRKRGSTS